MAVWEERCSGKRKSRRRASSGRRGGGRGEHLKLWHLKTERKAEQTNGSLPRILLLRRRLCSKRDKCSSKDKYSSKDYISSSNQDCCGSIRHCPIRRFRLWSKRNARTILIRLPIHQSRLLISQHLITTTRPQHPSTSTRIICSLGTRTRLPPIGFRK